MFFSSPRGSSRQTFWPRAPPSGLTDAKKPDLTRLVPPARVPRAPSPFSLSLLLGRQVRSPPSAASTLSIGQHALLTLVSVQETWEGFKVLLAICAVCDFQSRLRKKTKMKLFVLSGLKNRMEKVAASSPVAQRPSQLVGGAVGEGGGRAVTWGVGEQPPTPVFALI